MPSERSRHPPGASHRPLGEWLVGRGLINRTQLFVALSAAHRHGCRFGDAVVWLGYATRNEVEAEAEIQDKRRTIPPFA